MTKQTPRQQMEAAIWLIRKFSHADKYTGVKPNLPLPDEVALDAVLAVFKSLPAMQEEPPSARPDLDSSATWYAWRARNDLRRQILAELEEG